jgi:uncharacterized SAM-binding protein YcdF (DUF218 family)
LRTSSYRPSRGHSRRWLLAVCIVLVLGIATSGFWLAALGRYLVRAEPAVPADMIVVLAGDFTGNRILTAADLVRRGIAPKALVSGPSGAYGLHESDLAIQFAVRHGYPPIYFIALPNDARSTRDEAAMILAALDQRHVHRVDIVTSDYHTRRAGAIFRAQSHGLEIHMVAAPDQYFTANGWWENREGRKTFLLEWLKTVAGWFKM